ncbi:hypothetical protein F1559_001707 [Cyanidiococcus yangmingshanensis]|uniref:Uncharacterized protein n=1 Tax=Cyanidiococcus yangmingshanensis TaxID=2690220 RepID=A0A7J7IJJ8_9RHOD|nr:hypothetical protein F1559_001707 [Cyanidiococcus yangmingshanensis]
MTRASWTTSLHQTRRRVWRAQQSRRHRRTSSLLKRIRTRTPSLAPWTAERRRKKYRSSGTRFKNRPCTPIPMIRTHHRHNDPRNEEACSRTHHAELTDRFIASEPVHHHDPTRCFVHGQKQIHSVNRTENSCVHRCFRSSAAAFKSWPAQSDTGQCERACVCPVARRVKGTRPRGELLVADSQVSMDAGQEADENQQFIERFLPRFSGVLAELELPEPPPLGRKIDTGVVQLPTIPGWSSGVTLVNQLRLVARRLPNSASAALHVGLCYLRIGDRKAARSWLELAVQRVGRDGNHALDFAVRHTLWIASRGLIPLERRSGMTYWDCLVEQENAWLEPNPGKRAQRLGDLLERRRRSDADLWNNLGVALAQEEHCLLAAACLEQAALHGDVAPAFVNYAQLMALTPFACTKHETERQELLRLQRSSAINSFALLGGHLRPADSIIQLHVDGLVGGTVPWPLRLRLERSGALA